MSKIISYLEIFTAKLLNLLPLKYITFESNPDFSDNSMAVYLEFIRRNNCKKYKFVWLCRSKNSLSSLDVISININDRIKRKYYIMRSKLTISCNSYIGKYTKNQTSIYLGHGIALKSMNSYKAPDNIDYFVGLSTDSNHIMSKAFDCSPSKFVITGYPRNDSLFSDNRYKLEKAFNKKYKKIIVWYPTFRQHSNSKVLNATRSALPIINNEETARIINEFAREQNMLIVLKPHFSQDLSYIKSVKLSNIIIITDDFFKTNKFSSYEFVGSCDALITDYSSIYFDYLLCNKPIAAVWEDIEEYRANRGFCIDIDYYMKGAYKIFKTQDLLLFLKSVADGENVLREERKEINDLINKYQDGNSTKRVVDFLSKFI